MSRRGILFRLGLIHLIGPDGPISEDGNLVLGNGEEATLDGGNAPRAINWVDGHYAIVDQLTDHRLVTGKHADLTLGVSAVTMEA